MVVTLLVVTVVASLALAGVYNDTLEPIRKVKKEKKERAIKEVIPEFDTITTMEMDSPHGTRKLLINYGYKQGELVGTAIETYSMKGYSGYIQLMVGILPDGNINKIEVLQQKETPGLGTKMTLPMFKEQFYGKHPDQVDLSVAKDGGIIDAITAATISSRAFCDAVSRAYTVYDKEGGNK